VGLPGAIKSQINNIRHFSGLFPPLRLARGAVTLPFDYIGPTGRAAHPMVINILITSRCNMNCAMCSASDLRGRHYKEMSAGDIEHIAGQAEAFRPSFFIGGGEPFARDDIVDVIAAVKGHGHPLGIVTNGLRLDPDRGRKILDLGIEHVMVSIHGPRDVHDAITGVKGAFERVTENLTAFCRDKGSTRVMLNFVLSRENLEHIDELVELGRRIGVDKVRIEHLLYMTDDDIRNHESWLTDNVGDNAGLTLKVETFVCGQATVDGFAGELPGLLDEVKAHYGDFVYIKPALSRKETAEWYSPGYTSDRPCFFIWRSLFIDPEGFVIPCQYYSDMKLGNALDEPILEIWNSRGYRNLRRLIRDRTPPACSRCCKT